MRLGVHYLAVGPKLELKYSSGVYAHIDWVSWVLSVFIYPPRRIWWIKPEYNSSSWFFSWTLKVGFGFVGFEFVKWR